VICDCNHRVVFPSDLYVNDTDVVVAGRPHRIWSLPRRLILLFDSLLLLTEVIYINVAAPLQYRLVTSAHPN
jgi:hypothetical protein